MITKKIDLIRTENGVITANGWRPLDRRVGTVIRQRQLPIDIIICIIMSMQLPQQRSRRCSLTVYSLAESGNAFPVKGFTGG